MIHPDRELVDIADVCGRGEIVSHRTSGNVRRRILLDDIRGNGTDETGRNNISLKWHVGEAD